MKKALNGLNIIYLGYFLFYTDIPKSDSFKLYSSNPNAANNVVPIFNFLNFFFCLLILFNNFLKSLVPVLIVSSFIPFS